MTTNALQKLREDLADLQTEISLMSSAAPNSAALRDLRKRADEIQRAIESMWGK